MTTSTTTSSSSYTLSHLFDDVLGHVLSHLKVKYIIHHVSPVNKRLRQLIASQSDETHQFWKVIGKYQVAVIQMTSTDETDDLSVLETAVRVPRFIFTDRSLLNTSDSSPDSSPDSWEEQAVKYKRQFLNYLKAISPYVQELEFKTVRPFHLALKKKVEKENSDDDDMDYGIDDDFMENDEYEMGTNENLVEQNTQLNKQLFELKFPKLKNFFYDSKSATSELSSVLYRGADYFNGEWTSLEKLTVKNYKGPNDHNNDDNNNESSSHGFNLIQVLESNKNSLKDIQITSLYEYKQGEEQVLNALMQCNEIEKLNIYGVFHKLVDPILPPSSFKNLKELRMADAMRFLAPLLYHGLPKLEHLDIYVNSGYLLDNINENATIQPLPSLKYFKCGDSGYLRHMHKVCAAIGPDLEELHLDDHNINATLLTDAMIHSMMHLKKIQIMTLSLQRWNENLKTFLQQNTQLHTLKLGNSTDIIPQQLATMVPHIRSLSFNANHEMTADQLRVLLSPVNLPSLRKLEIERTEMSLAMISTILAEEKGTTTHIRELSLQLSHIIRENEKMHVFPDVLDKVDIAIYKFSDYMNKLEDRILFIFALHGVKLIRINHHPYFPRQPFLTLESAEQVSRALLMEDYGMNLTSSLVGMTGDEQEELRQKLIKILSGIDVDNKCQHRSIRSWKSVYDLLNERV